MNYYGPFWAHQKEDSKTLWSLALNRNFLGAVGCTLFKSVLYKEAFSPTLKLLWTIIDNCHDKVRAFIGHNFYSYIYGLFMSQNWNRTCCHQAGSGPSFISSDSATHATSSLLHAFLTAAHLLLSAYRIQACVYCIVVVIIALLRYRIVRISNSVDISSYTYCQLCSFSSLICGIFTARLSRKTNMLLLLMAQIAEITKLYRFAYLVRTACAIWIPATNRTASSESVFLASSLCDNVCTATLTVLRGT